MKSAPETTVALVFSPEGWVEELHRHLSHHGGARVRQIVVEPAVALDEEYDVLVVSDRWPALTFGFVVAVHERDRSILGVFDPDEPAGKDHLLELGVDATIAADADVAEFVASVRELRPVGAGVGQPHHGARRGPDERDAARGALLAVCGPRGSGVTEVALGVAVALARRRAVLLLDAHEAAPALAGRLALGFEPNLGNAVDACAHGVGTLDDATVVVAVGRGSLRAVPGHPSAIAAAQVSTHDLLDVVAEARRHHDFVVVDLEARSPSARAITQEASAVVGVAGATPVGIVRTLEWVLDELGPSVSVPLHLVVNRAPRGRFRQEEIRGEIERTIRPVSLCWCPQDRAVELAAWDGDPVGRGAFRSACAQLAARIDPDRAPGRRRRAW
jgi:MinD-like ATPase involved in chromosome partitioning or flagellar assembly